MPPPSPTPTPSSFSPASINAASNHAIGVNDHTAYTWATSPTGNRFGQLGRSANPPLTPQPVSLPNNALAKDVFAGGTKDSGHTAILTTSGSLYLSGCDRWQQLGLGSSNGGGGYTWVEGRVWQSTFIKNHAIEVFMIDTKCEVIDVAIGGDHTLVLASNRCDVYVFGRGGQGQLGLNTLPFISPPVRSSNLSVKSGNSNSNTKKKIHAVCAFENSSFTLDEQGGVLTKSGKWGKRIEGYVDVCRQSARERGLLGKIEDEVQ